MKRMKWAAIALLMAMTATAAETHTAKIDHVTIFTNGAQVERSQSVQLTAGEQTVTFTGMSPYMDFRSLQVRANGRFTVLGVSHRSAYPDSARRASSLRQADDALKAVDRRIQQANDEKEVIESQRELLKTNCSVSGRTVATPLANIRELNNYYSQEMLALKKRAQTLDEELLQLSAEREQKKHVRDSIASVRLQAVTAIDVKVSAAQACRGTFSISYYVTHAGWSPSYDVRSVSTSQPLELSYKANIHQNTREEWTGISLTLSSANPNRSNVAPQLQTYWLDFEPEQVRTNYRSRSAGARATADAMVLREVVVAPQVEEEVEEESELIEVSQREAPFGFEFEIKTPLTLPSNGRDVTTEIARYQLPATYEYRCYPKHDKEAFLVADATDWMKLNLLPGQASVYFENAYVGKSALDPTVATDTLHFSLGRDQGILVSRTKVNDTSVRRFLGSNQEQTMTWKITVKNNRREAVNLTVYDQTPIARNSNINVSIEELSGGQLDRDTGIVSWPIQLQAGQQRELLLQYKVKYPKNKRLSIE